jgi:MYXO-CTERM domain-containing protein
MVECARAAESPARKGCVMNGNTLGWSLGIAVVLLSASTATAETCVTDKDCVEAGTACGTQVCNVLTGTDAATGACIDPMGTGPFGSSCNVDTDCKCAALGATCISTFMDINYPPYCSITTPDGGGGPVGRPSRRDAGPVAMDAAAILDDAGDNAMSAGDSGAPAPIEDGGDDASPAAPDASVGAAPSSSSGGCGCVIGAADSASWAAPASLLGIALAVARRRRAAVVRTNHDERRR